MLEENELIMVLVGFMVAFVLAFGIGANDVANSFGTSVGSKVLTLRSACILATICEISGAILLGSHVSQTMRADIVDLNLYNSTTNGSTILAYGHISALASSCIWLIVATILKFPISGTHSIVGAMAGFTLVVFGSAGVQWFAILKIALSWVISPFLSGAVSSIIFLILKKLVLSKEKPLEPALLTLPFFYGGIILINMFSVMFGLKSLTTRMPIWAMFIASLLTGLLTGVLVYFAFIPFLRKRIINRIARKARICERKDSDYKSTSKQGETLLQLLRRRIMFVLRYFSRKQPNDAPEVPFSEDDLNPSATDQPKLRQSSIRLSMNVKETSEKENISEENFRDPALSEENDSSISEQIQVNAMLPINDRPEEAGVFSFTQILTATFGSFAHGGNDVSNAIGPLIGLWIVVTTGDVLSDAPTPIGILIYGGVGISVGLWIWGRRVIETVGEDLSLITPSSGVCIEIGSALTVLIASKIGIPISTTHCKVGSVICVGWLRSKENVNWRLFLSIIITWAVTLPISAGISALVMFAFMKTTLQT